MLAGLHALAPACVRPPLAASDGGSACQAPPLADAARPLFHTSCGGTVTATGTTLAGAFAAASVEVDYHCGTVTIAFSDAAGDLRLTLSFPFHAEAGAAGALGERRATVLLERAPGDLLVDTTGSITLTAISDPAPTLDAGPPGSAMVAGSFSVDAGCLTISGSFSSPWCATDSLCG